MTLDAKRSVTLVRCYTEMIFQGTNFYYPINKLPTYFLIV